MRLTLLELTCVAVIEMAAIRGQPDAVCRSPTCARRPSAPWHLAMIQAPAWHRWALSSSVPDAGRGKQRNLAGSRLASLYGASRASGQNVHTTAACSGRCVRPREMGPYLRRVTSPCPSPRPWLEAESPKVCPGP